MAGCIPVLLQMPILFALFRFFPSSIELRGQGFLWAHDLSTYDSIWDFGFDIPFYGDHMSLFALLMTASTLLYTWSNSQLMGSQNQMPGMKWMMYLMPIMFLGFMNSYSSGLSYYYFLANMITFGQTWLIQKFVIDHDALHKTIQENKLKPKKVSKFQQKLEEMQKQNQDRVKAKK
jgi:YidC/Oxa1 family membrane protein insertase